MSILEKQYLYILPFQSGTHFKAGITDSPVSRISTHNENYDVDLSNSYLFSSTDAKVPVLLERELLTYFHRFRDFAFKPIDGYTEIFSYTCFHEVIEYISQKTNLFPDKEMILEKGVELPPDHLDRLKRWEMLLYSMKVYGYYPSGIMTLLFEVRALRKYIEENHHRWEFSKSEIKLNLGIEYVKLCQERLAKSCLFPFLAEHHTLIEIQEHLDYLSDYSRLNEFGLERLYMTVRSSIVLIEHLEDWYYNPFGYKPKKFTREELFMMKRTGRPSNKFLRWKEIVQDNSLDEIYIENVIEEFGYNIPLYDDDPEVDYAVDLPYNRKFP